MAPRLSSQPNMLRSNSRSNPATQTPVANRLTRRNSSGKSPSTAFLGSIFSSKSRAAEPLFTFGLVADIQYALKDPQIKTCKGGPDGKQKLDRRMGWSEGLAKLSEAVKTWNSDNTLDFVLSLGDVIEGNESYMQDLSQRELKAVLEVLDRSHAPVRHILGNHDRRISRDKLLPLLGLDTGMTNTGNTYYSFQPADGWRFICLDTTEICTAAVDHDPRDRKLISNAIEIHARPDHSFHGMVSAAQLDWLSLTLAAAQHNGEYVIIATHYPLKAARHTHLALNSEVIIKAVAESNADVVAVLAGHDHSGASVMPATGTEETVHITLPGMIESPRDSNAFASVAVFEDGSIDIAGYGTVPTHSIRRSTRKRKNN